MMATPTIVSDKLGSAPKPAPTFFEKMRKLAEAAGNETSRRLEIAKAAFSAELEWQKARRLPPSEKEAEITTRILAGIAVDAETCNWIALQEGLNLFGADSLRVEQGRAEGSGAQAAKSYYTNDTVVLEKKTYVLKLFSTNRFSRRVQMQKESL